MRRSQISCISALCAVLALVLVAPSAQGAASDPLFVFVPKREGIAPPEPFPYGYLNGPCGMGVDPAGRFYVSDYKHDLIAVYDPNANYTSTKPPVTGATGYIGQLDGIDPLDGPCGLAFDAAGNLRVNDYHRAVIGYGPLKAFGAGTAITGAEVDGTNPTGVAVDPVSGDIYVDDRTQIAVFDSSGAPVMEEGEPLLIGQGTLADGYGLAFSTYPGSAGRLYVPDAASETVKVYDPAVDKVHPVAEIDGADTPQGEFTSLRDAAIAIDGASGEVYLIDNLQPEYTEKPQALVDVFDATGAYEGHLKYLIGDALPAGLAVDNSPTATQGRVYVTSGNTAFAAIYAYPPGAATTAPVGLSAAQLSLASSGGGGGSVRGDPGGIECAATCEATVPAGARVSLSAVPDAGSVFSGWSGACSGKASSCVLSIEEATSVRASFSEAAGPPAPAPNGESGASLSAPAAVTAASRPRRAHRPRHRHGARYGHRRRRHRDRRGGSR